MKSKRQKCLILAMTMGFWSCKGVDDKPTETDEDLFEQGIVEYEFDDDLPENFALTSQGYDASKLGNLKDDIPANLIDKCSRIKDKIDKKLLAYENRLKTIERLSKNPNREPQKYKKIIRNQVTLERIHRKTRVLQRLGCIENADPMYLLTSNHIVNGDFELRVVSEEKSWDIYSQQRTPGWRVEYASNNPDTCSSGALLEFQTSRTNVLDSFSGKQFAELDSHCHSDRTADTRVRIFQVINTVPGHTYKISFQASARSAQGELELKVYNYENRKSETALSEGITLKLGTEPNDLKNQVMSSYVHYFTATGERTKVTFQDTDEDKKTYGVLLDDIKVVGLSIGDSPEYQEGANIKENRRKNPASILSYENENSHSNQSTFLSLGLGGSLEVTFSDKIAPSVSGQLPKIHVSEITYGDNAQNSKSCGGYLETAKVDIILEDGTSIPVLKDVNGASTDQICGDHVINLSDYSITSPAVGLRFVDTTQSSNRDGYDIDYIGFKSP